MRSGILFGRYLPPHRGHMFHIAQASTLVDVLTVVIIEDEKRDRLVCEQNKIPYIDGNLRLRWMCEQLQDINHIKIRKITMDQSSDPQAVETAVKEQLNESFDVMFVKKEHDLVRYQTIFLNSEHVVLPDRSTRFPLVSGDILSKPLSYWGYLLGSARPHFVKRILITGTESSGKTTLIKSLGKLYNTSWCEEVGRHYPDQYTGGNEEVYNTLDFSRMAWLHKEKELSTYRTANRVAFVDTDAVVTQYYSQLYLQESNEIIESIIKSNQYDLILMLCPDVAWVADGKRLNSDQARRIQLHEKLKDMYHERGFSVVEVSGNYKERLDKAIALIDALIERY